ncbi:hypothetical protein [Bremerella sp. P1]|nr:hypothetical protein [Bremerella sp. P1]WDI41839.1 hypothetical protein PSR63_25640 [Bremerella sp. P1]
MNEIIEHYIEDPLIQAVRMDIEFWQQWMDQQEPQDNEAEDVDWQQEGF